MGGFLIFIGAENIITPLGSTAEENYANVLAGHSGIKSSRFLDHDENPLPASTFPKELSITQLLKSSIEGTLSGIHREKLSDGRTLFILSTTKGDIKKLTSGDVENAALPLIAKEMGELVGADNSITVSQACISGVQAMIMAHDLITAGSYDHVVVAGADLVTEFTHSGFLSLYAISDQPCRPYDKNRKGVSLGEGAASLLISRDSSCFVAEPMQFLGGSSSNDANHISGPSRTGEGLFRCVNKTLELCNMTAGDIDFINAHGTATEFNDEMESIAFDRLAMTDIPLHSLKGYFGHTLGAAGLVETSISIQSLRANSIPKNKGYTEQGTSKALNIITEIQDQPLNRFLKTASGFGGCNASCIIQRDGV